MSTEGGNSFQEPNETNNLSLTLKRLGIHTTSDLARLIIEQGYGEVVSKAQLVNNLPFLWSVNESVEYQGFIYIAPYKALVTPSGFEHTDLTASQFGIAGMLIVSQGLPVSRQTMLDRLVKRLDHKNSRTLDVHMSRLREKIGDPECRAFQTVRRVGYRLAPELITSS